MFPVSPPLVVHVQGVRPSSKPGFTTTWTGAAWTQAGGVGEGVDEDWDEVVEAARLEDDDEVAIDEEVAEKEVAEKEVAEKEVAEKEVAEEEVAEEEAADEEDMVEEATDEEELEDEESPTIHWGIDVIVTSSAQNSRLSLEQNTLKRTLLYADVGSRSELVYNVVVNSV